MKNTEDNQPTIAELLRQNLGNFTPSEILIVNYLLCDYPLAGLVSITELSEAAGVSTPTVMRMLRKIGHSSFTTFQKALKEELQKTLSDPIAKHDRWAKDAPETHVLNRLADQVAHNLRYSLKQVTHADFDALVDLLADEKRTVHVIGGRISRAFAAYLVTHLDVIRGKVYEFPPVTSLWPQHLLKVGKDDVLLMFDVRRYEQDLFTVSQIAASRGAKIALFTDQWLSPITAQASYTLPIRIEGCGGWDSGVATLFFVESLIVALEERLWANTAERVKTLEGMFDMTGRFRRQASSGRG